MRALVSWSGGKDSAFALDRVRRDPGIEVVGLLTTFSREFDRVSMHGVRRALIEEQAEALGLPLVGIELPSPEDGRAAAAGFTAFASNAAYESAIRAAFRSARADGVEAVVFGDVFLEDLRRYRETLLAAESIAGVFPLWKRDTTALAEEMIDVGLRATVTCIDPKRLDRSFAGRSFDADFVRALPPDVDPCGENGEFHSFAFAGPMFPQPIAHRLGQIVDRDGYVFADVEKGAAPHFHQMVKEGQPPTRQ